MEKPDIVSQLKHSLEMNTIKRDLLLFSGFLGIPALTMLSNGDTSGTGTLLGLFLCGLLAFYIWRIISIFRHPEGYILAECILAQPHFKYRGGYYFTITFPMPNGEAEILDTHAIFNEGSLAEPSMEDYVNKTAWIAYNPATDMVVVIG